MKLNILGKSFRNQYEANDELQKIEGIKYGEKLFKDYVTKSSFDRNCNYHYSIYGHLFH